MIKYHYAFDENKRVVGIDEIDHNHRHGHHYYCLNCGCELIPKLGAINAHHFAHSSDADCKGDHESYMHELAKHLFKKRFDEGLAIGLVYSINEQCCLIESCSIPIQKKESCHQIVSKSIDVHKFYDIALVEKSFGGFTADVLLVDSKNKYRPLLVEIFVTHKCEEDKINSGLPIFEIKIESEEDAKKLYQTEIVSGTTYNFDNNKFKSKTPLNVNVPTTTLILNKRGESKIWKVDRSCMELNHPLYDNPYLDLFFYGSNGYQPSAIIQKAVDLGFNVKNCRLCIESYCIGNQPHTIRCKRARRGDTPSEIYPIYAYGCPYYQVYPKPSRIEVEPIIVQSLKDDFNHCDFTSYYKYEAAKHKNEMEFRRKQELEKEVRQQKIIEEQKLSFQDRIFSWFEERITTSSFYIGCHKKELSSQSILIDAEISYEGFVYINCRTRYNQYQIIHEKNVIECYNKDDQTQPHLFIKIFTDQTEFPPLKDPKAFVIFVRILDFADLLGFKDSSTITYFMDQDNCKIYNKEKLLRIIMTNG